VAAPVADVVATASSAAVADATVTKLIQSPWL